MPRASSSRWYAGPILFASDVDRAVAFVAQVDRWGYRLMIVRDPDGNELYFPYPADDAAESSDRPG